MPWQQQIAYYRARAAEYEVTSYRDVHGAVRRIAALARRPRPGGDLLEVACGTGMSTRHLAGCAATVTTIDAAPEMIALARQQVTAGNVTFVTTDILTRGYRGAAWPQAARENGQGRHPASAGAPDGRGPARIVDPAWARAGSAGRGPAV